MAITVKGGALGNLQEVEAASLGARVVPYPADPGALGSYRKAMRTNVTAGMTGGATVYSFRYGGANLCIIKKIILSLGVNAAFAAGALSFDAIVARAFSANDTAGTAAALTGNQAKLRTSYAPTGVSNIQIITAAGNTGISAGTRVLDTDPFASTTFTGNTTPAGTTTNPSTSAPWDLFRATGGEETLTLATNEGFIINGTVPATGTWTLAVDVTWLERTAWV